MMRPCDYENVSHISIMNQYEIQTDMVYMRILDTILEMKKNNKIISGSFTLFSPTAKRILVANAPIIYNSGGYA